MQVALRDYFWLTLLTGAILWHVVALRDHRAKQKALAEECHDVHVSYTLRQDFYMNRVRLLEGHIQTLLDRRYELDQLRVDVDTLRKLYDQDKGQ